MTGDLRIPDDLRPSPVEVLSAPSWDVVRDDAARLRVAAAQFDAAVVAGLASDSLVMTASDQWPSDVAEAFHRLGLYDHYSPTTIQGVVSHLSAAQRLGLTNSVKGTVFESRVVDHINHGQLDVAGSAHADLADGLTQPGWDASLTSANGAVVGHVQMKETAEWHVLADHLHRYPSVPDVVTTHEAAAAAAAHSLGGNIIDSGLSDATVTDHVRGVVDHIDAAHALHEVVPEFALIAILAAAAVRMQRGEDKAAVGKWVADQAAVSGAANLAALAVQVATGTVIVRPIVTLGTRFTIARARTSRAVAERLGGIRDHLELTKEEFKAGFAGDD